MKKYFVSSDINKVMRVWMNRDDGSDVVNVVGY